MAPLTAIWRSCARAAGYVLKEVRGSGLIDAVRQVAMGRSLIDPGVVNQVMARIRAGTPTDSKLAALTDREREVLDLKIAVSGPLVAPWCARWSAVAAGTGSRGSGGRRPCS